jgi:uncharacterized membrane protein YeaQ/YmgE (transglycosylase-associated protein family)
MIFVYISSDLKFLGYIIVDFWYQKDLHLYVVASILSAIIKAVVSLTLYSALKYL